MNISMFLIMKFYCMYIQHTIAYNWCNRNNWLILREYLPQQVSILLAKYDVKKCFRIIYSEYALTDAGENSCVDTDGFGPVCLCNKYPDFAEGFCKPKLKKTKANGNG